MAPAYQGGIWEFYDLSNGSCFMAPKGYKEIELNVVGNYFTGTLSGEAAGIVACLCAWNAWCWQTQKQVDVTRFYRLRDFAFGHKEADLIIAAID